MTMNPAATRAAAPEETPEETPDPHGARRAVPGPSEGPDVPRSTRHARGALLSATPLGSRSPAELTTLLSSRDVDASTVRHGVTTHRLTYATITPSGAPTTASALLALPIGGGRRLVTVSENHGTIAYRGYAPSTENDISLFGILLHASGGRAVVAPDYLGLGTGPGTHPYLDTRSSVSASLDALRAARAAAPRHGRQLDGDVYVTGFSQGGRVALALGRELSRGAEPGLRLRALAPISGPYDIAGAQLPASLDGRVDGISAVFYISYFLVAQNRLHPLYSDPREVFRAPYADRVEELFGNDHPDEEIVEQLPSTVEELVTDEWYETLRRPTGALAEVIRINDGLGAWAPRVPVRFHTSSGDRDVPLVNTLHCARDLAEHGVRAKVIDHGDIDHVGTYMRAVSHTARWFARLG